MPDITFWGVVFCRDGALLVYLSFFQMGILSVAWQWLFKSIKFPQRVHGAGESHT
jgi:hypothetical protein